MPRPRMGHNIWTNSERPRQVKSTGSGIRCGRDAFLVAGLVALLTARSYALLSTSYPSRGGTVTFLNRAFGPARFAGGLNEGYSAGSVEM